MDKVHFQLFESFLLLLPPLKRIYAFEDFEKGRLLSASFDTNLFNEANLPVSLYTAFLKIGGFMFSIASIFDRFALMPLVDTKHPRNLPLSTPKILFVGFSFKPALQKFANVSLRSLI